MEPLGAAGAPGSPVPSSRISAAIQVARDLAGLADRADGYPKTRALRSRLLAQVVDHSDDRPSASRPDRVPSPWLRMVAPPTFRRWFRSVAKSSRTTLASSRVFCTSAPSPEKTCGLGRALRYCIFCRPAASRDERQRRVELLVLPPAPRQRLGRDAETRARLRFFAPFPRPGASGGARPRRRDHSRSSVRPSLSSLPERGDCSLSRAATPWPPSRELLRPILSRHVRRSVAPSRKGASQRGARRETGLSNAARNHRAGHTVALQRTSA